MRHERGNILFLILLAIILFVALSYAITSQRDGSKNANSESIEAETSYIMQTMTLLENTVLRLRMANGCRDTEISFHYDSDKDGVLETNGQDLYYNPLSPPDKRCYVFDKAGGGMSFPQRHKSDPDAGAFAAEGFYFGGYYKIKDIGTDDYDLVAGYYLASDGTSTYLPRAKLKCEAINQKLLGQTTQIDDGYPTTQAEDFKGVYGPTTVAIGDETGLTKFPPGKMSGCYYRTNSTSGFHVYHVLIAR